jgi:hypothetical protein
LIADRFGDGTVFKDVDSIQPGDDFIDMITDAVGSCEVLLALIGNQWLTITDRNDQRRLDDPQDFVRLEVEAALNRNVRVIPILVQGARMPRADELPDSLAKLARRQAIELTPRHFKTDAEPLLKVLDKAITKAQIPLAASGAVVAARPEVVVAPRPDAAHFELVINRMAEGNLVTFLGSSGAELAAGLAGKFNIETPRKLSEIAQYIYVTRGRPDLYRALRQILTVESEPEPVHRFLAGLPRTLEEMSFENRHQLIVNTSFDMALEQAFDEEQEPYDLVVYMASGPDKGRFIHFPFEGNPQPIANPLDYSRLPIGDDGEIKRTVIVKIYGAVDGLMGDYRWRENYVITDDDYINYLSRGPRETLIPVQILDKLTDSHCLFLSYPVHDWGQRVFLDRVWGGKPVAAASWAVEPDPDILTKASWQQFHVDLYLADLTQYIYELQEKITRRT